MAASLSIRNPVEPPENEEKKLRSHTLRVEWDKVVEMYAHHDWIHSVIITASSHDTALHVAIKDGQEHAVEKLVQIMDEHEKIESALQIKNNRDNTPLHLAALKGSVGMCKCILGEKKEISREYLLPLRNKEGESPLFLAALSGHFDAFTYLDSKIKQAFKDDDKLPFCRRENGDTILHSTLQREHFNLAWTIIDLYPELLGCYNEKGLTPLHVLATKPSAFKSSSRLKWWEHILYYSIPLNVQIPNNSSRMQQKDSSWRGKSNSNHPEEKKYPKIYTTCFDFLDVVPRFVNRILVPLQKTGIKPSSNDAENPQYSLDEYHYPANYVTFFEAFILICRNVFGLTGFGNSFWAIVKMRTRHKWSSLILNKIMRDPSQAYVGDDGKQPNDHGLSDNMEEIQNIISDRKQQSEEGEKRQESEDKSAIKDTALLVAAKNGVLEVVNKILDDVPVAIYDTTSDNKNVLLVAVENRQTYVFEAMRKRFEPLANQNDRWFELFHEVDSKENTILHLTAQASILRYNPWQIPGSAMQMHWEIKWFQYVKDLLPPHFLFQKNKDGKTPGEIFTKDHETLVEKSSAWLKDTSESCSVVAALIAGVSFATSSTVPGGNEENSGKPNLQGRPAFNLFAITTLIALFFSVTALVMFLAILSSRKQARDFRRNLPLKLLLGLSTLFVSIAAMLVSFCAAHVFVLTAKMKEVVFPIYVATCIPVTFYAVAQCPLYLDLLKAVFRRVPQPSYHGDDL